MASAAPGQPASDWERERNARGWREREVVLPAPPRRENLVEFFVSATTTFRFFIDARSITTGDDGVVRYTLVARSAEGVENISYEGIRCEEKGYRIYAAGAREGWTRIEAPWRKIEPRSIQRWRNALQREYFCPEGFPVRSAEEGVRALRSPANPN